MLFNFLSLPPAEFENQLEDNPIGIAQYLGDVMGRNSRHFSYFAVAFGESLFRTKSIPDRIKHCIENPSINKPDSHIQYQLQGKKFQISSNEFDYFIDIYSNEDDVCTIQSSQDRLCWEFVKGANGVVSLTCTGFYDVHKTKEVAYLIVWVSNMLGYEIVLANSA